MPALQLTAPELAEKIFWDKAQWVAGFLITIYLPVFATKLTDTTIRWPQAGYTPRCFLSPVDKDVFTYQYLSKILKSCLIQQLSPFSYG